MNVQGSDGPASVLESSPAGHRGRSARWLASRDPLAQTGSVQVYLLALLAIVVSTYRGEPMKWIADAPPLISAALSAGAVLTAHPERWSLLRL